MKTFNNISYTLVVFLLFNAQSASAQLVTSLDNLSSIAVSFRYDFSMEVKY